MASEKLSDIARSGQVIAIRASKVGVIITRGDLALECGWERLVEVHEEILWVCEAARVPVIWVTERL